MFSPIIEFPFLLVLLTIGVVLIGLVLFERRSEPVTNKFWRALAWLGYALLWLWVIALGVLAVVGFTLASVAGTSLDRADWVFMVIFALGAVVWVIAIARRISLKWPLFLLALLLLPMGTLFFGAVGAIGLGKLIVMSVGRRNVFGWSTMNVKQLRAQPRGLVDHAEYD